MSEQRLEELYRKLAEMIKNDIAELMDDAGFPKQDPEPTITQVVPVCYWITESPDEHLAITYLAVATQSSMQDSMVAGRNLGNTYSALNVILSHHLRDGVYISVTVSYKEKQDPDNTVGIELAQRAVQIVTDAVGFAPTKSDISDELYMWFLR